MRKFTKEISALLAAAAVGTTACAGLGSASPESGTQVDGLMTISDEPAETEEIPPFDGGIMAGDPTETEEIPPLAGDVAITDNDTETEEIPPLAGDVISDNDTETEEIPPLAGDIMSADGDISGDGIFNLSDTVLLRKWLLAVPGTQIACWWAGDLNYDGRLNGFDLGLMKEALMQCPAPDICSIVTFGLYGTPEQADADDFPAGMEMPKSTNIGDTLYDVTPPEIAAQFGFRIFKFELDPETYLVYQGQLYRLGTGFGGGGTLSFAVADLNQDGCMELYYTYSWGSGIHRAQIGYFDTAVCDTTEMDYTQWNEELMLMAEKDRLVVYTAGIRGSFFVNLQAEPRERIGEISFKDGGITLAVSEPEAASAESSA